MSSIAAVSTTALSSLSAVADARAEALEKRRVAKQKDAEQAIETLKQARTSAKDTQKEMARRKLEQIKQRIAMLKMTASIDPAGTARQIAALSRELSSAVKAYASAAGASSGGLDASTASSTDATDAGSAESGGAEGEATAAETAVAATDAEAQITEGQTTEDGAAETKPDSASARAAELYRQIQSSPEVRARERDREAKKAEAADAEDFLKQARELAMALKDILQKVAQAAKARGESGAEDVEDAEDAEKALGQVQQQINSAAGSMPAAPVAVAA